MTKRPHLHAVLLFVYVCDVLTCSVQALAAMWDHLLLRTPKEIAATACSSILTIMQDQAAAPHHAPGHAPAISAQPTGMA